MTLLTGIILLLAIALGGALQRVAGMGFAMVVAPFTVIILQGQQGVVLTNMLGAIAGLTLFWAVRREVEWRRLSYLILSSLVGACIGALIVTSLDVAVFRIVVGSLLILAIAASMWAGRLSFHVSNPRWALAAGGATGTLVTMSGIGGPPMTIYAVVSGWPHRSFAATMQPFIAVISAIGAGVVLIASPDSLPDLPAWMWAAALAALLIGLGVGIVLTRVLSDGTGRAIVIILGFAGAVTAIVAGIMALAAD